MTTHDDDTGILFLSERADSKTTLLLSLNSLYMLRQEVWTAQIHVGSKAKSRYTPGTNRDQGHRRIFNVRAEKRNPARSERIALGDNISASRTIDCDMLENP